MRVAVLGTGTMGAGMARTMRRAGLDVVAWNRTRKKAEPLADDGIEVADSVGEAVGGADVVLTILLDTDAVLGVTDEITAALAPEAVWMQSATVGPDGIARIAEAAGDVRLLDAPVLGTKKPAEEGKLVPIVSGESRWIEAVAPVLDAIGTKTVRAGDELGQASGLKLACNAWIFTITAGTAQSIALAERMGISGRLFLEAIGGGGTDSPYAQLKGTAMLEGDFTPSFGLDGARKDLGLIAEAGRSAGLDTGVVEALRALFGRASENGHGEDDMAAVYTALR